MLAAQRRASISEYVLTKGAMSIGELAESLEVSEMTVRRDIDRLEKEGGVIRVHGGVMSAALKTATTEAPFEETRGIEVSAKQEIAKQAASMVNPGDAIALLGGSTVYSLAQELTEVDNLTIVTNSIPISDLYTKFSNQVFSPFVYLTGGTRTPTDSLVGNLAVDAFSRFNFDYVFMGTVGMDLQAGFSAPNLIEAETNRAIVKQAAKSVVLADHTKWGVRGFSSFANLGDVDHVIVDKRLPQESLDELREFTNCIIIAEDGQL